MKEIVALGELLIDFTPAGQNAAGIALYGRNPGGAPANVLAMAAKLGARTALIAKVGADALGAYLQNSVASAGIDASCVFSSADAPTTLAFVHLDARGERSFSFYRDPGADSRLRQAEIDPAFLRETRIFHFGSVSLTTNPARDTTLWAARLARESGAVISFDPNYRPLLWRDEAAAQAQIRSALALADIVKVSDEELCLTTGCMDPQAGAKAVLDAGASAVIISMGPEGSLTFTRNASAYAKAYPVQAVDTTGAGDAFWGAVLYRIRDFTLAEIRNLDQAAWENILRFANAAGGLTATGSGAIPAMPDGEAIRQLMRA